jgi:multiple sugar transport system permease protein
MKKVIIAIVLAAGAVVAAYPFLWMAGTALKSTPAALAPSLNLLPSAPQWENIPAVFDAAPFARYFFNSFLVAGVTTAAITLTSALAGYAFARVRMPGKGILFAMLIATLMVPFEVTLIPNFILIGRLGWYDSYAALIVPWCANAFSVFLLRQAFLSVPRDYYDAATLDGCGHLRYLLWIGLPLVRPTMAIVALFAFLSSYNSLLWPLVVTGREEMRVVQVGLAVFSSEAGIRLNLLMCASAIVMLPTLALYFFAQRAFEEGTIGTGLRQ